MNLKVYKSVGPDEMYPWVMELYTTYGRLIKNKHGTRDLSRPHRK